MLRVAAVAIVVSAWAGAGGARAQPVTPAPGAPVERIELRVGETVEREVGIAIGYRCDEPELIQIEMKARSEEANAIAVTGVREGRTMCRIGTVPQRPSVVLEIRVLPARGRR